MNKLLSLQAVLLAAILCTACASQFHDPNFGSTIASHQQDQTINPDGQPPMISALDGPKGAQVAETYRKDDGKISDERIVQDISD
ncbi:hypothetical protein R50073_35880 [Maricurvus nonylphenolicus]|uniref:hypothetical protein n=1 Tax=Maricurvus nonylphenolicus TaxID=1008307 RepID=UPI0036F42C78